MEDVSGCVWIGEEITEVLERIQELYATERDIKECSVEEKYNIRQEKSKIMLTKVFEEIPNRNVNNPEDLLPQNLLQIFSWSGGYVKSSVKSEQKIVKVLYYIFDFLKTMDNISFWRGAKPRGFWY